MRASLLEPPPSRLGVGRGTAILLRGDCRDLGGHVRSLEVVSDGREPPVVARRAGREWWAVVPFGPIARPTRVSLRLLATLESGSKQSAALAEIELAPGLTEGREPTRISGGSEEADSNLIAICMGTYNPPLDLFATQVESIRAQSWEDWVCVISDDSSDPERVSQMRRILGDDPRFQLSAAETRLGFYENFERALGLAPANARYIALCDQDDRWYPEKLETLARSLRDADTLAYSDMRIVTPGGEIISETYWKHRRNNSTDLDVLLIGNTITGAAALFRRALLDYVLPFPPRVGRAYHDHWLALVALACGWVRYVDHPLHDYVQHPGAVIGFASANADRAAGGALARGSRRTRRLAGRVARPEARKRYFNDYCRIALAATVLQLRCGEQMGPEKRAATERVRAADHSLRPAAGIALRSLLPGNQTMGVDRSVLAGLAWSRLARRRAGASADGD